MYLTPPSVIPDVERMSTLPMFERNFFSSACSIWKKKMFSDTNAASALCSFHENLLRELADMMSATEGRGEVMEKRMW